MKVIAENLPPFRSISVFGNGELIAVGRQSTVDPLTDREMASVSRDGGFTWSPIDFDGEHLISASGRHVAGRTGSFYSDDGWQTFKKVGDKLFHGIIDSTGGAWARAGSSLFRFNGRQWKKVETGKRGRINAMAVSGTTIILSVGKQTIITSTDDGKSWETHEIKMQRKSDCLYRLIALDYGFVGFDTRTMAIWFSIDGHKWVHNDVYGPQGWVAVPRGNQILVSANSKTYVMQISEFGARIEPTSDTVEYRALAYGPDENGDNTTWGMDRSNLYRFR